MRLSALPPLMLLASLACHGPAVGSAEPAAKSASSPGGLATTPVELRKPKGSLRIAGELRPFQEVALRSRLPAYVQQRRVDVGDHVKTGQVLVVLAAPERVAERAQAEAELAAIQSRVRRLEVASAREGAVAPLELEDARSSAAALEARVGALRDLEHELTVRAPFAGTVTQRGADAGALVGSGADAFLVSVADLSRLRLTVAVPERYARTAAQGTHVPFRVDGDTAEQMRDAVVSRTTGLLDRKTRTLDVELDVDNAHGTILAGSYAEVMWPLDEGDAYPWIPATALVRGTEGLYVWVKRGQELAKVSVEEVVREDGMVAVRAPLSAGALVVNRGSEDLTEGPWPGGPPP